jgi:integrase
VNRPRKKDRHLPRCVYFRHGAYYYVKHGIWHPLGTSLANALGKYARNFEQPGGGLDDLIDRTLQKLKPDISASTLGQYEVAARKLKKFLREFGDAAQVTPRDIVEIRTGMRDTPNMANRVLSFARQVFDLALEDGSCESNPAIGVKRLHEKKRDRLPTREELVAIYNCAGPRLQVIIDLLLRAGQRVNDTLRIRRSDLTDQGIEFRQQKTGAKVLVRWTPELEEAVARAKGLYGVITALTLLHNRRGKAPDYSTVKLQWEKACTAAGVEDVQLRDLRAMAATWAKRQGMDATLLLGHTSAAQTLRYLRDRDHKVAEAPSFGQLLDKGMK